MRGKGKKESKPGGLARKGGGRAVELGWYLHPPAGFSRLSFWETLYTLSWGFLSISFLLPFATSWNTSSARPSIRRTSRSAWDRMSGRKTKKMQSTRLLFPPPPPPHAQFPTRHCPLRPAKRCQNNNSCSETSLRYIYIHIYGNVKSSPSMCESGCGGTLAGSEWAPRVSGSERIEMGRGGREGKPFSGVQTRKTISKHSVSLNGQNLIQIQRHKARLQKKSIRLYAVLASYWICWPITTITSLGLVYIFCLPWRLKF